MIERRSYMQPKRRLAVLRTKFIPPLQRSSMIYRPKLMKQLKQIEECPLTLIHTGPGYGKSSALSSFLDTSDKLSCWYSLSKQDENFFHFIVHVVHAVREKFPHFGSELIEYLISGEVEGWEEELDYICIEFCNELLLLKKPFVCVLDDIHITERSELVKDWLQLLIESAPANVHIVLAGRVRPTWDVITRRLLNGQLLELTETDFIFSNEEIDVLLSDVFNIDCTPEELIEIEKATEGWAIALQMLGQQWKEHGEVQAVLQDGLETTDELFRFLTMEAFSRQPEEIKKFLLETSLFEEFNEKLCQTVFEAVHAGNYITHLIQQNLFVVEIGKSQYRYHALFRDFLLRQLSKNPILQDNLLQRVACYYKAAGDYEKSLEVYMRAGDYREASALLVHEGIRLLHNGKMEGLMVTLDSIPEIMKDEYWLLWYLEGEMNRYYSKFEQAMTCYRKLEELAEEKQDAEGLSLSMEGRAQIYLDTIQPVKAQPYLQKAINYMERTNTSVERKVRLYSLMSENLLNLGEVKEVESWLVKIQAVHPEYKNIELESRYLLRTGQFHTAKELLQEAKLYEKDHKLSSSHREGDLLLSLLNSLMGLTEHAKKQAEAAIVGGVQRRSPFVEAVGWARMGHAVQLLDDYDPSLAIQCYETSLKLMSDLKMSRGKSEAYMGLCLLYGKQGEYDKALRIGKVALEEPERVKDRWLSGLVQLALALVTFKQGDFIEAEKRLNGCEKTFRSCGESFGETVTLYWLSSLYLRQENSSAFKKTITRCLTLIQKHNSQFFFSNKTLFGPTDIQCIPPLLLEAKTHQVEAYLVEPLLAELGFAELASHPGYTIRVQTLGEFQVWLGEDKLDEKGWKRDKARELFQLFITRANQFIAKSEICHLLWPGQNEEDASRDLKVALNAMNKAIEPHRKARQEAFFITREDQMYGLNKEASIDIDAHRFIYYIESGLEERSRKRAKEKLVKGLELYRGEYLPSRRFDDWCIELREQLFVLYLRGVERVAQISVAEEKFDEAIRWCEQILTEDSCWEEAYRLLMYCYYCKQNRTQALRIYERCQQQLQDELGVAPLETTREMWKMIKEATEKIYLSHL